MKGKIMKRLMVLIVLLLIPVVSSAQSGYSLSFGGPVGNGWLGGTVYGGNGGCYGGSCGYGYGGPVVIVPPPRPIVIGPAQGYDAPSGAVVIGSKPYVVNPAPDYAYYQNRSWGPVTGGPGNYYSNCYRGGACLP